MNGYKVRRIASKEDLVEVGYDDLLDAFSFDELEGLYLDEDGQAEEFTPTGRTEEIEFAVIIDNRLYPTEVKAYEGKDGALYIAEEDFVGLF